MARAPRNSYGQSQYSEQLLQTVLTPATISGTLGFSIGTNLTVSSINVGSISAANIFSPNFVVGDLRTEVLNIGCQSLQGTYSCNVSSTIVGVRALGNSNIHGTFTNNVIVGAEAGLNLCNTDFSVYMGAGAGTYGQGQSNVVVGYGAAIGSAGIPVTRGNLILGAGAGVSNAGNSNVFLGVNAGADLSTNSNVLVVNTRPTSSNALLYGKFDTGQLGINCIPSPNLALHISGGSVRIERNLIVDGNLTTSTISGAISATNISGFAPNLHGGGNGVYGGVDLTGGNLTVLNTNASAVALFQSGAGGGIITLCNAARTNKLTIDGSGSSISASNILLSSNLLICNATCNTTIFPDGMIFSELTSGSSLRQGVAGIELKRGNGVTIDSVFKVALETGNITNPSNSVNYIGGVWLQSNTISTSVTSSSFIGGVNISNNNIQTVGGINASGGSRIGSITLSDGINTNNYNIVAGSGGFYNNSITSNSIGGVILSNGSIIGTITASGTATSIDGNAINNLSIPGGKLSNSTITSNQIADSNIINAKIASNAVDSNKIADGSIINSKIASNAIDSNKIADSNIINAKIADGAVTTNKIAAGAITSSNLSNGAVDGLAILNGAVTDTKIANNAINSNKILDSNVTSAKIAYQTIQESNIKPLAITGASIASNAISSDKLTSNLTLAGTTNAVISNASTSSNSIGGITLTGTDLSNVRTIYGGLAGFRNIDLASGMLNNLYIPASNLSQLPSGNQAGSIVLGALRIQWGIVDIHPLTSGNPSSTGTKIFPYVYALSYLPAVFLQQSSNNGASCSAAWTTSVTTSNFTIVTPGWYEDRSYFWIAIGGA